MKTAEAIFHFPVLGFTPDGDIWGFPDLNSLTSCGPQTLKDNLQTGMELIDSAGQRWMVRSIRRTGRGEPLLPWLLSCVLSTRQSRIEQELDELAPVSLDEIKERVRVAIEATSDNYCAEDEREEELMPRLAQMQSAKTVAEIFDVFGLDSFMAC